MTQLPDWSAAKQAFDRDGFVVVREFLGADELATLRAELDRYIRDVVPGLPEKSAFYQDRARPETLKQLQHMAVDPFFRDYVGHIKWQSLASALVGESANCEAPEWFNKPPGVVHPTPPHQDNYYFCLKPPNVVTIWLALDPVSEENGCLRYVRGSHLAGLRPHARSAVLGFSQAICDYGPADERLEVPIHLQPGDVVAHHGETIHRAEANRSASQQRRAFAMVYRGVSCRRDDDAFDRYEAALRHQHQSLGVGS
ncbi:MAG: phytanoyl-CoA dioxygenase family protein [Pirellulales bacterium]